MNFRQSLREESRCALTAGFDTRMSERQTVRKGKDMDTEIRRIPKSGELYRHFKDKLYQVVAVATHSETGEKLVIYQALYGDYGVYARPLEMFTSEVDREKYPAVTQKYRFERVEKGSLGAVAQSNEAEKESEEDEEQEEQIRVSRMEQSLTDGVNPKLMAFFDADTLEERYNILISMRDEVDDHLINSMAVALDVVIPEGEISDRYDQLKNCIRTKQRYETQRLR